MMSTAVIASEAWRSSGPASAVSRKIVTAAERIRRSHLPPSAAVGRAGSLPPRYARGHDDGRRAVLSPLTPAAHNQMPMAVWRAGIDKIEAAARAVDMPLRLDNANTLPTYPQQRQKQQEAA